MASKSAIGYAGLIDWFGNLDELTILDFRLQPACGRTLQSRYNIS